MPHDITIKTPITANRILEKEKVVLLPTISTNSFFPTSKLKLCSLIYLIQNALY